MTSSVIGKPLESVQYLSDRRPSASEPLMWRARYSRCTDGQPHVPATVTAWPRATICFDGRSGPEPYRERSMDERQSKWLVALSALLALLVLGVVFLEPSDPARDTDRRWTGIADGRTVDQVSAMILKLDGETIRVVRESGSWKWVEPIVVPAAGSAMDALVRSVLDLQAGEAIDVPPVSVGLTADSPTVTLETDGADPLVLRIGDNAPIGSAHIQLGDGPVQASRTRISARCLTGSQTFASPALPASALRRRPDLRTAPGACVPGLRTRCPAGGDRPDALEFAHQSRPFTLIDTVRFTKASSYLDTEPPERRSDVGHRALGHYHSKPPSPETMLPSGWRASGPNHPARSFWQPTTFRRSHGIRRQLGGDLPLSPNTARARIRLARRY